VTTNLNIGPEDKQNDASTHLLNLKKTDSTKKSAARKNVSLNIKDEIKNEHKKSGRICIVGELPRSRQGLGRAPMILAAFLVVLLLSAGQLIFLGKEKGSEALALASEAFLSLQGASQSLLHGEPGEDLTLFAEAEALFAEAEDKGSFLIDHKSPWLLEPTEVKSLRNILDAGGSMAEVGQHISNVRTSLMSLPEEGSLTDHIRFISETQLEPAAEKLNEIETLLNDTSLAGTGYEEQFYDYRQKLVALSDLFDLWTASKEPILTALGDRYPQHYLILLMNNDEIRLGGGFIGSLAIIEMNDGRLTEMEFHDVYEYDNQFHEEIEFPVHELRQLATDWRLRDSNISPDFPTTAEHAISFLDLEGGPGVDGVIAVNLSAAQAMIEELGEITIPSLSKSLTAETFPMVISTLVEAKVSGRTTPKNILSELIDVFLAQTESMEVKAALGLSMLNEINKKQILLYHRDNSVQTLLASMGLDAALPDLNELIANQTDFFMPAFTNIGGNKTDRYMHNKIQHDTQILQDGTILNAATLTRTHTFNAAASAWLKSTLASYGFTAWTQELRRVLGDDENHTGIRLYMPEGVQILEVTGDAHRDDLQFFYDPAEDISYYYFDQIIPTDTTETFTIIYSLPWNFQGEFQNYEFQLLKQPGLNSTTYKKTVTAPDDIMLSSEPMPSDYTDETDYILEGSFAGDVEVKVLYR
jgi:hypothetical protein